MKKLTTLILFLLFFISVNGIAQSVNTRVWNNHKCAVVLTYDDCLNVHLDKVIPALNARGFKATFYIPGNAEALGNRIEDWRKAAKAGHELGNHTLFHPCIGNKAGREWVSPDYDLNSYSINKLVQEIKLENTLLKAIDGKDKRTFAYTCGDMSIGDSSFVNQIKDDFSGARGIEMKYEKIEDMDLMNIGACFVYDQTTNQLIDMVKKAMETETLIVFLFHGVGGEHSINFDENEHNKLLDFLKKNQKDIWIAPLVEVSEFVKKSREK